MKIPQIILNLLLSGLLSITPISALPVVGARQIEQSFWLLQKAAEGATWVKQNLQNLHPFESQPTPQTSPTPWSATPAPSQSPADRSKGSGAPPEPDYNIIINSNPQPVQDVCYDSVSCTNLSF